jgi:hypothetical protein
MPLCAHDSRDCPFFLLDEQQCWTSSSADEQRERLFTCTTVVILGGAPLE